MTELEAALRAAIGLDPDAPATATPPATPAPIALNNDPALAAVIAAALGTTVTTDTH